MDKEQELNLTEIRGKIDTIDEELVKLFVQRMELSEAVAKYKAKQGLAVLHKAREEEVLEKVAKLAGAKFESKIKELYQNIFAISRSYQEELLNRK